MSTCRPAAAAFKGLLRTPPRRAFTLLEVMVAVAILGLSLTAILSAQFGAVKAVEHGRHMSVATGLARCRMSEIEIQLAVDGFQELDEVSQGPCCAGDDNPRMMCEWRIEKPTFPEPQYGQLDLDSSLGGDGNALGKLAQGAKDGSLDGAKNLGDVANVLGGQEGVDDLAAGGVGGVASMVMGMVYPDLKAIFEASTRRVTVSVVWQEGGSDYDLTVVQWVTKPQPGL
ncbi:MAG TPA: prepilin-type N-terminal cleavage/methylation domain-containing protein, partial [Sorangium sp.]|nr:prepilin-type N-terminal cleavage/methylation domain-containing protein [Sorangium sp.]